MTLSEIARRIEELPLRIRQKIAPCPHTGCWVWTACINNWGYGEVRFAGKKRRSHRVVYELLVGAIPVGLTIDHLCRNTACCNPAHLEPVSVRVNVLRGTSPIARYAASTACIKCGSPYVQRKGQRYCIMCYRVRSRERYAENLESNRKYQAAWAREKRRKLKELAAAREKETA